MTQELVTSAAMARIVEAEVFEIEAAFVTPYKLAESYGTMTTTRAIMLKLTDADGVVGWLSGRSIGLEVRGYRATERDLQELQRRQAAVDRTADRREAGQQHREERRQHGQDEREVRHERRADAAAAQRLRIVGAVVRDRVADPDRQSQIMAAARERIAGWLDRGARFDDLSLARSQPADRQRVR